MPISFLPKEDYISQAVQGLNQNLLQIQQAKIAEKEKTINQYMKLVDVSLEGVRANNRDEILGDLETYRNKTAELFAKAEQENRLLNYKELPQIETEKKGILSKVAQSQLLTDAYKQATMEAMKLKADGKLDPSSQAALDKWVTEKKPIDQMVDPRMLVQSIYSADELNKVEEGSFGRLVKSAKDSPQAHKMKDGTYTRVAYLDPMDVKKEALLMWSSDPVLQRTYAAKGLGLSDFVAKAQSEYKVNMEIDKPPSTKVNINNSYGVKEKFVPYVENTDGTKSWVFNDEPINYTKGAIKGNIVSVTKGSDGKFYGELSIPKEDKSATKKMMASLYPGIKAIDKFGNDVYNVPLDASDYGAIMRKGLSLEDADKEGFNTLGGQRNRTSKEKTGVYAPSPGKKVIKGW